MKASICSLSCATEVNEAPCSDCPSRIENQISTWLSQEARVGVKWKRTVRMAIEPAVVLGLVGVEVVEDDMDGGVWIANADIVHKIQELDAPAARLVCSSHLAGGHLEGGEQRGGAMRL